MNTTAQTRDDKNTATPEVEFTKEGVLKEEKPKRRETVNGVRTSEVKVRDGNGKTMTILGNEKRRNGKKIPTGQL